MAIAASGAVSLQDFRTEFVGGSSAISLGDLYRGGSNIRANAANNSSTNLAASVPTSGVIDFNDFYGTAKGFRKTYTSGATNQNASSVFGDDYGVNYPKEIVINSGVELGATSTGEEALQINSGLSGGLTITNNGTLSGAGGSANGGAGGDAFEANVACTLINNGTIRAGGGGGGRGGNGGTGGNGGQGRTTYTNYGSWTNYNSGGGWGNVYYSPPGAPNVRVRNTTISAGSYVGITVRASNWNTILQSAYATNGYIYDSRTSSTGVQTVQYSATNSNGDLRGITSTGGQYQSVSTGTSYHNGGSGGGGGAGGNGGRGQGYNHGKQNGSGGSSGANGSGGGTNAGSGGRGGTGGTGGNGGTYGNGGGNGASGATGNSGGNGNHTNGSGGSGGAGGSSGGAAGKYIRGLSNVTFTNNGTVQGGTA